MIYFMQPVQGGAVKIGYTSHLSQRHAQLELHYDCKLAILAVMEGEKPDEFQIHKRFGHLRFGRSEQFRPAPDLMEFIGRPLLGHDLRVSPMTPRQVVPQLFQVCPGLATPAEAAAILEIGRSTFLKHVGNWPLTPIQKGNRLLYRRDDLKRFMESCITPSRSA